MSDTIYFVNGSFVKKENAVIHVNDIGILRGYAVFDYFKTYFGEPFHIEDNLTRLLKSGELIGLKIPYSINEMKGICQDLLKKNNFPESNIRVVVTGGVGADSKTKGEPGFIMTCEPRYEWDDSFYTEGIKIKTVSGKREIPLSKTTNYINAVDYISRFKKDGYIEYLYVSNNTIFECTSSNIFIIKGREIFTPEEGVLQGVTRKIIFKVAQSIMPLNVRDISIDEVFEADEIFISSTEREIMPVVIVDNKPVGNGTVGEKTKNLINEFRKYVKSRVWITN